MEALAFLGLLGLGLLGWYGLIAWDRHNPWWMRAAAVLCFFGLTGAGRWMPEVMETERTTVARQPQTVSGLSLAVFRQPLEPFIGSSVKETYHTPDCRYAGMMKHARTYDSHDQARADGKQPCKYCLTEQ